MVGRSIVAISICGEPLASALSPRKGRIRWRQALASLGSSDNGRSQIVYVDNRELPLGIYHDKAAKAADVAKEGHGGSITRPKDDRRSNDRDRQIAGASFGRQFACPFAAAVMRYWNWRVRFRAQMIHIGGRAGGRERGDDDDDRR